MSKSTDSMISALRSLLLAVLVIALTVTMSAIPSSESGKIHRADLFGIYSEEEAAVSTGFKADLKTLDKELEKFEQLKAAVPDSSEGKVAVTHEWTAGTPASGPARKLKADVDRSGQPGFIPIEDFDTSSVTCLGRFGRKLRQGEPVRIAFLGDSFIEGDILTSDLRRMLQTSAGGAGVGFIPCDIPFAIYNRSVSRKSSGWTTYSIMKRGSVPEKWKNAFLVSGYSAVGGPGARTIWKDKTGRPSHEACIYLKPVMESEVEVIVNDSLTKTFTLPADGLLHEIRLRSEIKTLSLAVKSGQVVGYGVRMVDGSGSCVDNFSVRSNNGHAIFATDPLLNRQFDDLVGYDMVVLQYGLNILQDGQQSYQKYGQQLRDMIVYVRKCFPDAAIVVLGVSDRWIKDGETGNFRPINSPDILNLWQRRSAESCGVCYWNTLAAMRALGGMEAFAANGYVADDRTHINYYGGRAFASKFYEALLQCVYEADAAMRAEELARVESAALDSLMREAAVLEAAPSTLKLK
ncbi:MAG: hypothetical protein ACI3ZP_04935 [Candidatus Cryptobacteroides sp.]